MRKGRNLFFQRGLLFSQPLVVGIDCKCLTNKFTKTF